LHYHNTEAIAAIAGINELNIGHAIMAHSMFVGLKTAVSEMRVLIENASA
jgi:pyridoxine 5-phosphate synthase